VAAVDPISTLVAEMVATEVEHARESREGAEATYRATRWRVLGIAATAALVWLVISLLLIRNIVPRVRAYSGFAAGVDDGQPAGQLSVRGADELAELGHTRGGRDRDPLLVCGICGPLADAVSCEPLLVSGEVIGAILVNHPDPLAEDAHRRIRESVTQAAAVLANLRNLAIAEIRAATDALTGLPNNRAVQDTIKRMVALAGRNLSPLSAALLDLDHFKRINDAYGHSRGDEVLAAVATVLRSSLRESDFVGRYGGEEFLLLLPDTGRDQAVVVAEKLRAAAAGLGLSEINQPVTASFGIAAIPDDAADGDTLIRAADRALYAAKGNGRNRVELFISPDRGQDAPRSNTGLRAK